MTIKIDAGNLIFVYYKKNSNELKNDHRLGGSLMKIWNMNDFTGVVGVFNCQGASWCRTNIRNLIHDQQPQSISTTVGAADVEYLQSIAESGWNGDCIMYLHRGGKLNCQLN